jgi:predicted nucleotidyltransferase
VLDRDDPPPMAFSRLVEALVQDDAVRREIDELLALKRRSGEQAWLPRRPRLNAFLEALIAQLARATPAVGAPPLHRLDELLADTVLGTARCGACPDAVNE